LLAIAGYKLGEVIHRGRRSSAYTAFREKDGLRVVLKTPVSDYPKVDEIDRLRREFELLGRLQHPSIVRPVGLEPFGQGLALITQRVDGIALAKLRVPLELPAFLKVARALASALGAVHEAGMVYRSLEPNNVVIDPQTHALALLDFDEANPVPKQLEAAAAPASLGAALAFASPEQTGRMNRSVDARSDLYSLGVLLYWLITGRLPFRSSDPMALVHQHLAEPPLPPHEVLPSVPPVLSRILLRLLAKTAEDRYQSAEGLLHDLQLCGAGPAVPEFEIGLQDHARDFRIPERLYGRASEVARLISGFERCVAGRPELLLVSGYSGIGKSRLVHEIHRPVAARRGRLVSGKCDQFNRTIPLSALSEALRALVRELLAGSAEELARWRELIQNALGRQARVVTDLVPGLERIIGPQPEVPELRPREAEQRFHAALRQLLAAVCRPEHPLCIFLDDLQWIDAATLGWLESITDDVELSSLYIIGAYRDNEVSRDHPLRIALDRLKSEGVPIEEISLGPLEKPELRALVADALGERSPSVPELTALLYERTRGNPFFASQFLLALRERGMLRRDPGAQAWVADLEQVRQLEVSENVVDLMLARLARLAPGTQNLLTLAACIGSAFPTALLEQVAGRSRHEVLAQLTEAHKAELVRPSARPGTFRFAHDRIHQAAHSMLAEGDQRTIRCTIGRKLLAEMADPASDAGLFEAIDHLLAAESLLEDASERRRIAVLAVTAAERARKSTAYAPALAYVRFAADLVPGRERDTPGPFAFALALERAECEHNAGNGELAESHFGRALALASDDGEKAVAYEKKVHFLSNLARFADAYQAGREGAAYFGIELPGRFVPPDLALDFALIKWKTRARPVVELAELPRMTDRRMETGANLATALLKAAFQIRPELCVAMSAKLTRLALAHGLFKDAAVALLPIGPIFQGGILGRARAGDDWGQLCLAIVDRFENRKQAAEVNFVYGYFAKSWVEPLAATEEQFRAAYQVGLETGDFFHVSCACSGITQTMLMRGAPLGVVIDECDRYLGLLRRVDARENLGTVLAVRQTARNLRGETSSAGTLGDAEFDEAAFEATLGGYGSRHFAHFFLVDKLQALVFQHEWDRALEAVAKSAAYLKDSRGMQHATDHYLYAALLYAELLALGRKGPRRRWRRGLADAARRFGRWARHCPHNFLHKQKLLEAELAFVDGDRELAAKRYDKAIRRAARYGYRQLQALASERAGRFHLAGGQARIASFFLRDAAYGYERWGASALAENLERHYADALPATGSGVALRRATPEAETAAEQAPLDLDAETALKASQAIAEEVGLESLLRKLLRLLIANAGADRGVVLLPAGEELLVQAEATVGGAESLMQAVPLGAHEGVARSVISFVQRTQESLVLRDARTSRPYSEDPYVLKSAVRSILCAPLLDRGVLRGVVYLENSLASDAFTHDRVALLQLLSGQFAISITNATLYEELDQRVRERTAQLEKRNELIRATFGRYLTEDVVEQLIEVDDWQMGGENREVSIMMADLRGFTTVAGGLAPQQVVQVINNFLGVMTRVIIEHGGTIDEFIGDAILVIFGAPIKRPDDAERAVACAVAMQLAMAEVDALNRAAGLPEVRMGIGINTGDVVVGNIGSLKRAKYGVVGANVNLASRIESFTLPGQILVSRTTLERAGPEVRVGSEQRVTAKGLKEPLAVYEVVGIGGRFALELPGDRAGCAPLARPLAVSLQAMEDKHLVGEPAPALLLELSRAGAVLRAASAPAPHAALEIRLTALGGEALYARVEAAGAAPRSPGADAFEVRFTSLSEEARRAVEELLSRAG
jgi:predicted ATPase/class 3 adenylate cyclase/tRNA A-37 threonylcarbamoyl transferase component Bud32